MVADLQCPWCRLWSRIASPRVHCPNCGHRIDLARVYCDCAECAAGRRSLLAGGPLGPVAGTDKGG